jgi:hypothetical protein
MRPVTLTLGCSPGRRTSDLRRVHRRQSIARVRGGRRSDSLDYMRGVDAFMITFSGACDAPGLPQPWRRGQHRHYLP